MGLTRFFMHQEGHRYTPLTLARQGPIWAVSNHAVQALLAPSGIELRIVDPFQGCLTQAGFAIGRFFIHAGKPLRSGTINDGCFMAPAMHVGMAIRFIF